MTIYVKIFAGLCNRFFQYAYGKKLISQGKKVKFIIADDGNTDILDILDLEHEKKLFISSKNSSKLKIFIIKFFSKFIFHTLKIDFFQNPENLENIQYKFKNLNIYQNSKLYSKIKNSNAVALHIRGGDYVLTENNCFSHVCTPQYYSNAISEIKKQIQKPLFIIFTNDRKYSEKILSDVCLQKNEFIFANDIEETKYDDGFDIYMMNICKANIIANSTFSWFGAYLNSEDKLSVICPEHWYGNGDYSLDCLLLDNWIKVKSK